MAVAEKEPASYGPTSRSGATFEARAEARQRRYRAEVLGVGHAAYGHWLDEKAARTGANFVTSGAHVAARQRDAEGKGVGQRTFTNMLASQPMAFNVFAPLATDPELAGRVLVPLIPDLRSVRSITFEHTPAPDVFRDQSALGGVDCDVFIEGTFTDGESAVIAIETKFVEKEFSRCGHRTAAKAKAGRACPDDVDVDVSRGSCLYQRINGYAYWERADEHGTLRALPAAACPFCGALWQLWVNHTLVHVEAARRGAPHARYLVCAPAKNDALLRGGTVLASFQALLTRPETAAFLSLDDVIASIAVVGSGPMGWIEGITARYAGI